MLFIGVNEIKYYMQVRKKNIYLNITTSFKTAHKLNRFQ